VFNASSSFLVVDLVAIFAVVWELIAPSKLFLFPQARPLRLYQAVARL